MDLGSCCLYFQILLSGILERLEFMCLVRHFKSEAHPSNATSRWSQMTLADKVSGPWVWKQSIGQRHRLKAVIEFYCRKKKSMDWKKHHKTEQWAVTR
jgi:hypothetical protein